MSQVPYGINGDGSEHRELILSLEYASVRGDIHPTKLELRHLNPRNANRTNSIAHRKMRIGKEQSNLEGTSVSLIEKLKRLINTKANSDLQFQTLASRKSGITPIWIFMSIGLLVFLVIGMVSFSSQKGLKMTTVYAPLVNADTEIKLNVSVAHMWVEEILSGDPTKSLEGVWEALDRADKYAKAMLEGGKISGQEIIPLEDVEIRAMVGNVIKDLKEFRAIAKNRLYNRETSLAGSPLDHRYDKVHSRFTKNADQIKSLITELIATDLQYFKATQYTLMTVCFIISMVTGIALYRFEHFRDRVIQALQKSNENLEKEIDERIKTEKRLIESQEQLRSLGNQLQTVREEEKAHIAREVHDELGQNLTAIKMELGCLNHDLLSDSGLGRYRISGMSVLIDETIQSVQRIATELRPQILDVLGLAEAVRWEASEFEKRTGIQCQLQLPSSHDELSRNVKITIFRIFQEAMTNIARHSGANKVKINLQIDAQQVVLEIMDNGRGIVPNEIFDKNSLGLLGIRERVHFLKGQFGIKGNSSEGTQIRVTIPMEKYESIK